MNRVLLLAALALGCAAPRPTAAPAAPPATPAVAPVPTPPIAKQVPHVLELHGEQRTDEFYWLREKTNPEVVAYLEAENAYADAMEKDRAPVREALYQELLGRIQETDLTVPYRMGDWLYYRRTETGKAYPILCRKPAAGGDEQVMLDLNQLAAGKEYLALGDWKVSDDGRYLAFNTDETGFRQYVLQLKDLTTGQLLPERVEKTGSIVWAADNQTVFYTTEDAAKRPYRLIRHVRGTPVANDVVVFEEKDERFRVWASRSRSRRYVVLNVQSLTTSEVHLLDARTPAAAFKVVAPRVADHEYDVEDLGDRLAIRTNRGGRNFEVMLAPAKSPGQAHWKPLLPHRPDVMVEGLDGFQGRLVVYERQDAVPHVAVHELGAGNTIKAVHRIAFPEANYSVFPEQNHLFDSPLLRLSYQSAVTPPSVFDYDMAARTLTLLKEEPVRNYDRTRYDSARTSAVSHDGVKVPVSLVFKKGTPRDGSAPLLLEAYGAYGFPNPITFSSNDVSLLDRGFVLATAHVRGGGDLGKPWHDAGRMLNKKNTFHDTIAVAEALIAQGYTSKGRLALIGGSAGGLLTTTVANWRPDLFRVVMSMVPFVDVITTMSDPTLPLTVAEYEEWGNPAIREQYEYMKGYDPYLGLGARRYPVTLVRTGFNDSQVMYWEPTKYVARMRRLNPGGNPVLFKINMAAGHGGRSGRYDRLREVAWNYAFLFHHLGVDPALP